MRLSLVGVMRVSIGLCLLVSLGATAGKWGLLSQTERRAADLSARIAPLVERIQVVPEIVTGLHDALPRVASSRSAPEIDRLEQSVAALLARDALPRAEQEPPLSEVFSQLLAQQRRIVAARAAVAGIFRSEARRLEDLSARQGAALSDAVMSLADPTAGLAPADRAGRAARVAALSDLQAALSALIIHSLNLGQLPPQTALSREPRLLRDIDSLAAPLNRLPEGAARSAVAGELAQFRRAVLAPGGGFARIRALQELESGRDRLAARAKARVGALSAWAESSAAQAATAFRAAAETNRVTLAHLRNFDLITGLVFWLGCIVVLWLLIERKLIARIEALVAHKREMAEGNLKRPVAIHGEDKLGELEAAVERARIRAEVLAVTNTQLRAVLDGAPDGILTVGEDTRILDANPAAAQIFGHAKQDLIGQELDMLMPPRDRGHHLAHIGRAKAGDPSVRAMSQRDVIGLRRNGEEFPLAVSLSLAEMAGKKVFIGMIRDISVRKAAEDRLLAALAELERSNADLDNFAYVASHDLKAPLRVIDNASSWLEEDLAEHLDDDTRESMDLLRGRVRRMEKLLDDLLAYSRVGRVQEESRIVSGAELIEDLRALTNLPDGFTLETEGDFEALRLPNMPLRNVLLNLVSNALKHHDKSSGMVRISVTDTGRHLCFEVADDGPGIPPEFHKRVLRMFQTLKPRDEVEGSGMGLAMVKKYVEVAGGTLEILSDGGRGTTFRFSWPRVEGDARKEGEAA